MESIKTKSKSKNLERIKKPFNSFEYSGYNNYSPPIEIQHYIDESTSKIQNRIILRVNKKEHIESLPDVIGSISNTYKINDIRKVNKFFEAVNEKLPDGGIYIGCVETMSERRRRILNKFPKVISYPYYLFDFVLKRIFPKWSVTKKIYFILTKGRNRVISKVETFGRLKCCGFEIINSKEINNLLYFTAKKIKPPAYDHEPTYGALVKLKRIGKDGKIIKVYKFRTMHPYAEYLQAYIFMQNNLKEGGKFKDDFRITSWGRFMRRFWLDELPMLINLFKGDLKLVGVRPLSSHYLSLYKPELREKKIKHKPGLLPPFYADLPKTLNEIMESEERYLLAYEKSPLKTDVIYFFKVFNNIVFKRARSS
jgi:lipopolysaccharide/colanic/teichoic acid biosynthesis glycosyltransferase